MDAKEFPEFAERYKETFGEEAKFDNVFLSIDDKKDYLIGISQLDKKYESFNDMDFFSEKEKKYIMYAVEFNKKGELVGQGARIEWKDISSSQERLVTFEDKDDNFKYTMKGPMKFIDNYPQSYDYEPFTAPNHSLTRRILNNLRCEKIVNMLNKEKRNDINKAIDLIYRIQVPICNKELLKINDGELYESKHPDLSKEEKERQKRVKRFGELRKMVIKKRQKLAEAKAKQQAKELAKQQRMQKTK